MSPTTLAPTPVQHEVPQMSTTKPHDGSNAYIAWVCFFIDEGSDVRLAYARLCELRLCSERCAGHDPSLHTEA
jgi:hypothetical protein